MMKLKSILAATLMLIIISVWVSSLAIKRAPIPEPVSLDGYGRIKTDEEPFRIEADENSFARFNLQKGEVVRFLQILIGSDGNWWMHVEFDDGKQGYIHADSVEEIRTSEIKEYLATEIPTLKEVATSSGPDSKKEMDVWNGIPEKPILFSYAYDYTYQILSDKQLSEIKNVGKRLYEQTGIQAIVLVVNTFDRYTSLEYTTNVINKWGIGSKEKNDGILITLAVQDHSIAIGVGTGLDTILTDEKAGEIIDNNLEQLIAGKYGDGLCSIYHDVADFFIFLKEKK